MSLVGPACCQFPPFGAAGSVQKPAVPFN